MAFILRTATMASVLALGVAGAQAADLTYEPAPVAAPVAFNWTGFYVGVHGGIGGGEFDTTFTEEFDDYSVDYNDNAFGAFGGAQIGYNWQFSPNWVAGVEADIAYSGIESNFDWNYAGGSSYNISTNVDWFGTLRGRIGYAWDNLLVYGTGGAAYGDVEVSTNYSDPNESYGSSFSDTRWGWTIGAGVEYGITQNITLKTEYLYVDLGSIHQNAYNAAEDDYGQFDTDVAFHTLKVGLNYKF
ncbi:outer membrane protein [Kaistia adipata]|uniref:outer membrane protein n=1 Tax=Kaistia adipata TaxID=166954 RepID=UPI00048DBF39|nr:outer membrane protein [Kaistia adipata]